MPTDDEYNAKVTVLWSKTKGRFPHYMRIVYRGNLIYDQYYSTTELEEIGIHQPEKD